MTTETPAGGSTARRILLGAQLRRRREAKGISREEAGYTIRASESKISRMELGRVSFKERDVADLLILYGVTDPEERDALVALAREASQPGWWRQYADVVPSWFHSYIGLEESASLIRTYEVQFVPGLLQTEEYARAIISGSMPLAPQHEVERRVTLRGTRQELLTRVNPPQLWAVVDEAALRRPIGGRTVMRDQLDHLMTLSELPNLTLQVMPFLAGRHTAEAGAFTILRFPDSDLPDIVYLEQLTSAVYLDKRDDVDQYLIAMERLSVDSEPPERTTEVLRGIRKEI